MKMYYYRFLLLSLMFVGHLSLTGQVLNTVPVFEGTVTNVSSADQAVLDEQFSDYSIVSIDQDSLNSYLKNQNGVFEFELNIGGGYQWQISVEEGQDLSSCRVRQGGQFKQVDLGGKRSRNFKGSIVNQNGFSHVRIRNSSQGFYGTFRQEGVRYDLTPLKKYIPGADEDLMLFTIRTFSADWMLDTGDDNCDSPVMEFLVIVDYSMYQAFGGNEQAIENHVGGIFYEAMNEVFIENFNLEFIMRGDIIIHDSESDFVFGGSHTEMAAKLNGYWDDHFGCAEFGGVEPVDAIMMFHNNLTQNAAAGAALCNPTDANPGLPVCWVGDGADARTAAHEMGHLFGVSELELMQAASFCVNQDEDGNDIDLCGSNTPCSSPNGSYLMCNQANSYPGFCLSECVRERIQTKINTFCDGCLTSPEVTEDDCLECWIGMEMLATYDSPLILGCDGSSEVEYTMTICNNYCESQTMDVYFKYDDGQLEKNSEFPGFANCTEFEGLENWCSNGVTFESGECKEYTFVLNAIGVSDLGTVIGIGGVKNASSQMPDKKVKKTIYGPLELSDFDPISGNISDLILSGDLPNNSGPCFSTTDQLQLRITDDLVIDQDYCFGNYSKIIVDPGVKIIIQDGAKLYLILTELFACGEIWDGIEIEDGGDLYMHLSSIRNAEKAITAFDGAELELYFNEFVDNYRGLYIPQKADGNNVDVWTFVGNTFYFENGPGMPPLPGYPIGVLINDVAFIDIQGNENIANDQGINYFHHMNNGIVANNSNLTVSGCRFENISDRAVHVRGNDLMTNVFSYEGGRNSYGLDIKDCTYGIVAERIHTDIAAVDLQISRYAVTLRNLVNGVASVRDCQMTKVKDYGIQLTNNHLLEGTIEDNIIISHIDEAAAIGIELNGTPFVQAAGWNITNNVIWMPGPHIGIKATAGGNDLIGNNTISNLFSSVPHGFVGLSISGSEDVTVTCNEITGSGSEAIGKMKTSPLLGKGIEVVNAPGVAVSCNTLDEVQIGVNFWMTSLGADLSGNTFNNHDQGLLLGRYFTNFSSGWANIGLQQHRGNQWASLGSGIGAKHLSNILDVVDNSLFFVDQIENVSFFPSNENDAGAGWFQSFDDFGTTYYCEDISNNTCPEGIGYQGFTGGGSSNFENKIASGTLQTEEFAESYAWLSERQLFNRVQKGQIAPEMGASFSNFQNQNQQSAIGRFDQAKSDFSQLFELESGDKIVYNDDLQAIKNTIANLVELNRLIQVTPEGSDSIAYINQKAARLASLQSLQSDWSNRAQLKVTQIENRKSNLDTSVNDLSSDAIYKSNEKSVNQIYLSFLGGDGGDLADTQIASLLSIAEQCPLTGGNAVFEARSLLALSTDRYVFDDDVFCDQGGRRSDEGLDTKVLNQVFSIFPNPAKDNIELSYQLTEEGGAEISIQTRMGQVILTENIAGNQQGVKRFDLDRLPAGVYFCSVRQNGQLLYIEKFVVIK